MASHIDLWSESSGQCIAGLWRHYPMSEIATVLRGMPAVTLHCSHQLATKAEFDKWQDAARQFARKAAPHRASFFKFSFEPDMAQYVTDGLSCFDGLTMLLLAGGLLLRPSPPQQNHFVQWSFKDFTILEDLLRGGEPVARPVLYEEELRNVIVSEEDPQPGARQLLKASRPPWDQKVGVHRDHDLTFACALALGRIGYLWCLA